MNRVLGDYFENLLYKIFVSVDERITIEQLAEVLQIDVELVKVCILVRMGKEKKEESELMVKF
jgi:FAM91 N-terminus